MEITEEQRKRAEANRLAALAKRKALIESSNQQHQNDHWKLFKCRKLYRELAPTTPDLSFPNQPLKLVQIDPNSDTHFPERVRVKLEICSPDSFSVTPLAVQGFAYPGEEECLRRLSDCLSNVSGFLFKRHVCEEKENERKI